MSFDFAAILQNISFESLDFWFLVGVVGFVFLFLFTIGRDFSVTLLLAIYLALASINFIPFFKNLNLDIGLHDAWVQVILFLVFVCIFFWLQARSEFFEPYTVPTGGEVIVFGIVISGMLIYLAGTMIPELYLLNVAPILRTLFLEEPGADIWLTLPILTMLFLRGRT